MSAGDREQHEAPPFEGVGDDLPSREPSREELQLFAYLDGELEEHEIAPFEARLANDRALQAKLRAVEAIAGFVREDAPRTYARARVDAIADDVMAKLASEPSERRAPVVEIAAAQQTRAMKRRPASTTWVAIGGIAAVAAAIALFAGTRRAPIAGAPVATASTPSAAETVAVTVVPTATKKVEAPIAPGANPGVEVEDLEVGEGATVIYTGSAQGAVVWVNDKR